MSGTGIGGPIDTHALARLHFTTLMREQGLQTIARLARADLRDKRLR